MSLKEAFQVQNKISESMSYINHYLSDADNVMTITEKHLRSKALAGQQDDTVDVSRKADEGFDVGRLLGIWQELMEEKERLGAAIGKAKAGMDFNLDAAVVIDYQNAMEGIYTTSVGADTLDESPMAYKSIDDILSVIGDTVKVLDILKPICNFKAAE